MEKKSKKAQEGMTIGTIIIIILALVVLVFLIFAFARGGGNLMDYISNLFGGGVNLDTIKNSCNVACTANANFEFCGSVRTLKLENRVTYKGSCATLNAQGIDACPAVTCQTTPEKCTGAWRDSCLDTENDVTSSVGDSEGKDISKLKCCKAK
jgi:hypothetical protein